MNEIGGLAGMLMHVNAFFHIAIMNGTTLALGHALHIMKKFVVHAL